MKRFLSAFLLVASFATAASAQESWKEHRSEACRCAATFPGTPETKSQKMQSKYGTLDSSIMLIEVPQSAFYGLAFLDYPKDAITSAKPEELLAGARDAAVKNVKGTLKSENKITMNGYPGIEFRVDAPGEKALVARFYLVKERLYQALVVTAKARAEAAENKKFLDSLKFDKPS